MILIGNKTPESITIGGKEVASIAINNETVWTSSQEEPVDDPVVTCVDNVVTMTCSTSGATINYSTDGGTTYSVYSTPITISATTNYTVYASKARMSDSNIVTYTATFKETVATPVVSCTNNVVTMTCATNGATIKYSTNGGSSYSTYSGTITISANTTYTVYATKSGMFDSATTTYTAIYKTPIGSPLRIDKRSDVGTRTVSLTKNGNAPEINLEYSFNNSTWQTWTPDSSGNRTMSLPANTSMYIRGNNPNGLAGSTGDDFYSFSCDKDYGIAGDIRSLVSHYEVDNMPYMGFRGLFKNSTTLSAADYLRIESTNLGRYCYSQMFYGCTNLLRAPHNLPASIVSERAYDYMFYGCTSLEVMPIIAATSFGKNACRDMFYNCSALTQQWTSTTASVKTRGNISFTIASSNANSFQDMFRGCSSLVNASGITATQTNNWKECVCQNMFRDCSALTSAPSITFSSFANGSCHCQGMFHGCTSLVSTPNIHLNAPTLYALTCKNMYYGCTHLTTAPEIKATTLTDSGTNHENGSLAIMFYNCSSLTYIKVNFTDWNNGYYTDQWTYGLPSSGRFDCPSGLAQTKNANGNTTNPHYIPYNWTVVNDVVLTQEVTGGLDSRTESGSTVYTINARIYTGVPGCDYTIRKAGYPSNTYTDTNNNGYMLWTYDHADLVNGKSHFYVTVEKDGVSTGEIHYAAYDYGIETIE